MGRKISKTLVIPTYTISPELIKMTIECIRSHREQVDTIIVAEDSAIYSPQIAMESDIYILGINNVGFTKNVNRGWKLSDSDFTIIANSDTYLIRGNIDDLCQEGYVTCPEVKNLPNYPGFTGSYFVVPRDIQLKFGMLDERFKTYQSDMEYLERIQPLFKKVNSVSIFHHKGETIKTAKINIQEEMNNDNIAYDKLREERK